MFKDYDKYLSTSLKVYIFVLFFVFILKLVGMDYFALDVNNLTLNRINNFCLKYKLDYVWYFFTLNIYSYVFVCICSNAKGKHFHALLATALTITLSLFKTMIPQIFTILGQILILYFVSKLVNKKVKIKKVIILCILNIIFQLISLVIRNDSIIVESDNFIKGILMNIDYIIMCIILYKVWHGMKTRCYNPNFMYYCNYGGRGIKICDEWLTDFLLFYNWAINNGYEEGLTIDRINNDGDYEPSNCRWITRAEQNRNQRKTKKELFI